MHLSTRPLGSLYSTRKVSDIAELALGCSGLRIVVETHHNQSQERLLVEYHFEAPPGFRFLDEGDLMRYWESKAFTRGYHLFEVLSGGWMEQECRVQGMLSVTSAVGMSRGWFICTTNGCLDVLSVNEPLVREFA